MSGDEHEEAYCQHAVDSHQRSVGVIGREGGTDLVITHDGQVAMRKPDAPRSRSSRSPRSGPLRHRQRPHRSGLRDCADQTEAIAAQSFSTLNRICTKAVLAETYDAATREGLSFHLSYIDRDHPNSGGTGFETDAMRQLYDYGYEKARSGAFWVTDLSQIEAAKDAGKAAAAPIIR